METLVKYLEAINQRINFIYQDLVTMRGCLLVHLNTEDNQDNTHQIFHKLSNEIASFAFTKIMLNFNIILDEDNDSINLVKIFNKLQATPNKYNLSNELANHYYSSWKSLLDEMKKNPVYKLIKDIRDKDIAHQDISNLGNTIKFPSGGLYKLFDVLVAFTNIIFNVFHLPENTFDFSIKSNFEELFNVCTPPSSKRFK